MPRCSKRWQGLPLGVEGIKAVGKITRGDYDSVLGPMLRAARQEGRRLRFIYHLGYEFEGFSAGGVWEDAWMGMRSIDLFDACAIESDVGWIREATRLASFLVPCPVRVFGAREREGRSSGFRATQRGRELLTDFFATPGSSWSK